MSGRGIKTEGPHALRLFMQQIMNNKESPSMKKWQLAIKCSSKSEFISPQKSTKNLKKLVSNSAVIWRATFRNYEYSTLQKIFWRLCAAYKKRLNPSYIKKDSQEYFSTGCCQIKKTSLGYFGFTSLFWFLKIWQAENIGVHSHSWGEITET